MHATGREGLTHFIKWMISICLCMLTKKEEEFQNKNNAHALLILTCKHKHIHKPSKLWELEFIAGIQLECLDRHSEKRPMSSFIYWSCMHDCANNFKLWLHSGNSCDLTVWLLHAITSTRLETADLLHKSPTKSNWLCYIIWVGSLY